MSVRHIQFLLHPFLLHFCQIKTLVQKYLPQRHFRASSDWTVRQSQCSQLSFVVCSVVIKTGSCCIAKWLRRGPLSSSSVESIVMHSIADQTKRKFCYLEIRCCMTLFCCCVPLFCYLESRCCVVLWHQSIRGFDVHDCGVERHVSCEQLPNSLTASASAILLPYCSPTFAMHILSPHMLHAE